MSIFSGAWMQDLFKHGLHHAMEAVRARAEELLHDVEHKVSAWAGHLALRYSAVAALVIAAILSVCFAAKEGMIAAGLPAWAASLILAVVTAAGAWLLLQQGKKKSEAKHDDPSGNGKKDGDSRPTFSFEINIPKTTEKRTVVEVHRPKPRSPRRRRPNILVRRTRRGWQVESGRGAGKKRLFSSKRAALKSARAAALKHSSRVIIVRTKLKPPPQVQAEVEVETLRPVA